MKFNIIKNSKIWVSISVVLMVISWVLLFVNRNFSIEFTGWVNAKIVTASESVTIKNDISDYLSKNGYKGYEVSVEKKEWYSNVLLKVTADEKKVADLSQGLKGLFVDKKYVENQDKILEMSIVWPSVWDYMKRTAGQAIVAWLIFMWVYILFAFAWMREFVSPLMLWIITVVTMLFDISLPMGAYGLLMWLDNTVHIDIIFVIAILTIIGYSINDTIIIFDRVRENFNIHRTKVNEGKMDYADIFEMSLWQTMRRSLGTSTTVLIVVVGMYIFGTGILKLFSFTLMMWVLFGTYSSIFLAAPLAYLLSRKHFHK